MENSRPSTANKAASMSSPRSRASSYKNSSGTTYQTTFMINSSTLKKTSSSENSKISKSNKYHRSVFLPRHPSSLLNWNRELINFTPTRYKVQKHHKTHLVLSYSFLTAKTNQFQKMSQYLCRFGSEQKLRKFRICPIIFTRNQNYVRSK